MTRVAIVASSAIVRARLDTLVRGAGFEVAALHASGAELNSAAADVVLAVARPDDLDLPDELPVVLLFDAEAVPVSSEYAAVLPEDASAVEIAGALHAAAAGLVVMRRADAPRVAATRDTSITPREIEVLRMLADGLPNKIIAYRLGISEHTVKFHVTSILGRLNAASRAEAVAIGIRRGLILL